MRAAAATPESRSALRENDTADRRGDALLAAALLAVDMKGLRGAGLRGPSGPAREEWQAYFLSLIEKDAPRRKLPVNADAERILGGLDFSAALRSGKAVAQRGLFAEADGGVLIASMAERMSPVVASYLGAAMDEGKAVVERAGVSRIDAARFACLLLDEGIDENETPPAILLERVAFHIDLTGSPARNNATFPYTDEEVNAARAMVARVECEPAILEAIVGAASALGIVSLRAPVFCLRAASAAAALEGRSKVTQEDALLACRLVLGPRAIPEAPPESAPPPPAPEDERDGRDENEAHDENTPLEDMLVAAAQAGLLGPVFPKPAKGRRRGPLSADGGRSGAPVPSHRKGRPVGARRGDPRGGARLDLAATLRAAAPWRAFRDAGARGVIAPIYREDIRIKRFVARAGTTVIFVVDASGSSAMHRMAEAKGAVELLLSDCYSRRDHVALIAFRGEGAEIVLPPTRSLLRVRRSLGALPGGGGTPLAAGIAAAAELAGHQQRIGRTPLVVILSDGRGNISIDGEPDRARADEDARRAAQRLRELECAALFFDTSVRPNDRARAFSAELAARYIPLPRFSGAAVSQTVRRAINEER